MSCSRFISFRPPLSQKEEGRVSSMFFLVPRYSPLVPVIILPSLRAQNQVKISQRILELAW